MPPTHERLALAVRLDELPQGPRALDQAIEIASEALGECQRLEAIIDGWGQAETIAHADGAVVYSNTPAGWQAEFIEPIVAPPALAPRTIHCPTCGAPLVDVEPDGDGYTVIREAHGPSEAGGVFHHHCP